MSNFIKNTFIIFILILFFYAILSITLNNIKGHDLKILFCNSKNIQVPNNNLEGNTYIESKGEVRLKQEEQIKTYFRFDNDFLLGIFSNLIGVLVGAILAIPTGLWLDRWIKLKEQQEKELTILCSIRDELKKNKMGLEDFLAKKRERDKIRERNKIIYPEITQNAWKATQALGFPAIPGDYELYKEMMGFYECLEFIKQVANSLWNMFFHININSSNFDKKIEVLIDELTSETKKVIPLIDKILEILNKRLQNLEV